MYRLVRMLEQSLQRLGLSDKEARVYLASLELGQSTVQKIAIKGRVNRPTCYVVLNGLKKKGLVTEVEQGKKTVFIAEPPHLLEKLIEKTEDLVEARREELGRSLPDFLALYNQAQNRPRIRFYQGYEGYRSMTKEYYIPEFKNATIYAIAPFDVILESYGRDQIENLKKQRLALNIKLKLIYSHPKGPIAGLKNKRELREARYIPTKLFPFNGELVILPEWGFWLYNYKKGFVGIAVSSSELAKTLKALFDLAWQTAQPSPSPDEPKKSEKTKK